jgi:hypothetical protein
MCRRDSGIIRRPADRACGQLPSHCPARWCWTTTRSPGRAWSVECDMSFFPLLNGEDAGEIEARDHPDRDRELVSDDEQVGGSVVGHQLGCALERIVGSDEDDRLACRGACVLVRERALGDRGGDDLKSETTPQMRFVSPGSMSPSP